MEPQPPEQTPPVDTPPADPPPAQAPQPDPAPVAGWNPAPPAPPSPAARAARPGAVTAAGIVMIVIGVLVTLFGLLFVLFGTLIGGAGDNPIRDQFGTSFTGAVGGFIAIIGGIVAAFGILEVLSGIFVLPGRGWARITAIILSVIGGLISLSGVAGATGPRGGIVFPLIFLAAYVFVIWAMAVNGRWFSGR